LESRKEKRLKELLREKLREWKKKSYCDCYDCLAHEIKKYLVEVEP